MFNNSPAGYGLITIFIHWISAVTVIGLFALGFWMVDLTYYSSWYKTAPDIHKSVGILLLLITILRVLWRFIAIKPAAVATHKQWEQQSAHWAHRIIYLLMLSIMVSGILISTADGRAIWVFNWFQFPAVGELFDDQADLAGLFHQYAAYSLIGLVIIHAAGALKHHFIDKDSTLIRMLRIKR
ncbi:MULTISPECIES: cytochrome b [Shewanella]|jgi:cytochrome b561|uniref:Cytochrome b n=1 Tax=Shewanella holmiensis TaxID=2952222 RepID=A0A9X3AU58_9GAMM|nr:MULTISPECIES: cytochrome b [Shewanella]MCT7941195.1 cytochrome b [Shewanella holmiensis]MDP5145115.1 cytochrome b [Shewanella sp. ULN5]